MLLSPTRVHGGPPVGAAYPGLPELDTILSTVAPEAARLVMSRAAAAALQMVRMAIANWALSLGSGDAASPVFSLLSSLSSPHTMPPLPSSLPAHPASPAARAPGRGACGDLTRGGAHSGVPPGGRGPGTCARCGPERVVGLQECAHRVLRNAPSRAAGVHFILHRYTSSAERERERSGSFAEPGIVVTRAALARGWSGTRRSAARWRR